MARTNVAVENSYNLNIGPVPEATQKVADFISPAREFGKEMAWSFRRAFDAKPPTGMPVPKSMAGPVDVGPDIERMLAAPDIAEWDKLKGSFRDASAEVTRLTNAQKLLQSKLAAGDTSVTPDILSTREALDAAENDAISSNAKLIEIEKKYGRTRLESWKQDLKSQKFEKKGISLQQTLNNTTSNLAARGGMLGGVFGKAGAGLGQLAGMVGATGPVGIAIAGAGLGLAAVGAAAGFAAAKLYRSGVNAEGLEALAVVAGVTEDAVAGMQRSLISVTPQFKQAGADLIGSSARLTQIQRATPERLREMLLPLSRAGISLDAFRDALDRDDPGGAIASLIKDTKSAGKGFQDIVEPLRQLGYSELAIATIGELFTKSSRDLNDWNKEVKKGGLATQEEREKRKEVRIAMDRLKLSMGELINDAVDPFADRLITAAGVLTRLFGGEDQTSDDKKRSLSEAMGGGKGPAKEFLPRQQKFAMGLAGDTDFTEERRKGAGWYGGERAPELSGRRAGFASGLSRTDTSGIFNRNVLIDTIQVNIHDSNNADEIKDKVVSGIENDIQSSTHNR